MTKAFTYGSWNEAHESDAYVGGSVAFEENREYVLHLPRPISERERERLIELGGRFASSQIVTICFRNHVGRAEVLGVSVEIASSKVSAQDVENLLQEVSNLSAALIFSWKTPICFETGTSLAALSPIPYHQFQFLRNSMLRMPIGERLQDFISSVERSPIRRFESDRPVVPTQRVRRLDSTSLRTIFNRLDRLAAVPEASSLISNPLAVALTFGDPARSHFPAKVSAPARALSFDSPENRFVKHVLKEALALTYRFSSHQSLHQSVRDESSQMQTILESLMESPVIRESGNLASFSSPTQALAKADGYREIFFFWQQFSRHIALPLEEGMTKRLLEGRDIARLYEYWVFLRVLDSVVRAVGSNEPQLVSIRKSELGESLGNAIAVQVNGRVAVEFNPSYTRSRQQSYSSTLRPDVVVTVDEARFAFDAKYKLDRLEIPDDESDEDVLIGTYKQADLYKMHTYRDAISSLRAAVAVYPGHEFVFFARNGAKATSYEELGDLDGIGALPLLPQQAGLPNVILDQVIVRCLNG